ncbi:tRNA uridine-5-carboxymethylaminomethyl(34) synthesis GTPase MnmE [Erythrobacter sp. THAF29]|uniref:tRNA uridine-5-carboxymethylaminomethyl(34) synthesis GTPase MnmE n=1 Tax=Erythrobacter sp. THAF29 TaxID=2587851 RepID=UPI001268ED84|nr:tRNA uridine-5-carboxymethylaminomethyl(34) synthesis GTPase MnmE [Erythrobacter sp. THAF29]QFT76366.1 tRNA modification GTPase MnmE [Erythrobacter sp. THAF29]
MMDTIYAVSSGAPPAAIGVIRVSGSRAGEALESLTNRKIEPRRASLAMLRDRAGNALDEALVLWFPGPHTATGEDLVEFHCHGGRAVLAAVSRALGELDGLRPAEPGEFTRRAFANGRIDLAEAEGLADLLAAETELQRASAMAMAGGAVSRETSRWRDEVLRLSAQVEAALDFSDEDDVGELPPSFGEDVAALLGELRDWLRRPRSEILGEGFRVAIAGPPNTGKSTLFNALTESEAAITSPIAGTTRDVIVRSVAIEGIPFSFVDTAGLREVDEMKGGDPIEAIGIERARGELAKADVILWLGAEGEGPTNAWEVAAKSDLDDFVGKAASYVVSAATGIGVEELKDALVAAARTSLPKPGEAALNSRQHQRLQEAAEAFERTLSASDPLIVAEELRRARVAFDRLTGRATTEDMLDALFDRFCIGK